MNIYLITSDSIKLIDEELKKILKKETNIETFDLNNVELEDILIEAQYVSMFNDKRVIVVKNANIFGSGKIAEKKTELLLKYLESPNENTILIFTYNDKDMIMWLNKAAEENNDMAQWLLGIIYLEGKENGVDTEQNIDLGMQLLKKSAKSGNEYAIKKLNQLKNDK